jgi:hypothetical protein
MVFRSISGSGTSAGADRATAWSWSGLAQRRAAKPSRYGFSWVDALAQCARSPAGVPCGKSDKASRSQTL